VEKNRSQSESTSRHAKRHPVTLSSSQKHPVTGQPAWTALNKKPAAPNQPRILALHGTQSNNSVTSTQIAVLGLAKLGASVVALHGFKEDAAPEDARRGLGQEGERFFTHDSSQDSIQHVMEHIKLHGPYDGLFGFSVGAALCTMLCSEAVWRAAGYTRCPFKFVICCNGVPPHFLDTRETEAAAGKSAEDTLLAAPLSCASLHLIGEKDQYKDDSQQLVQCYAKSARSVLMHPAGHELPLSLKSKQNADFCDELNTVLKTLISV